jgi:hypothetical protein
MKTLLFGMAAALVAALAGGARAQEVVRLPGERDLLYVVADQAEPADEREEEYWLGVQLAALPELAKKQLGVEHGLAVEDVAPDSPAAKAEIKRFDILIKADDTPLKDAGDLVKSVEASQGKEMTLRVVREGKDRTVTVIATKRPETAKVLRVRRPEFAEEIKRLEEALAHLKAKAGNKGVDLLFARPAIVAPKAEMNQAFSFFFEGGKPADFPNDLSVQVNKRGKEPAQIHVKRGDKEWNITEKEIDQLPEELRPHVMHYLGKGSAYARGPRALHLNPQGKVEGEIRIPPMPPMPPRPPVAPRPAAAPTRIRPADPAIAAERRIIDTRRAPGDQEKLDAILQELKELRKEVDEVRSKK